jgi:hypothetical protein
MMKENHGIHRMHGRKPFWRSRLFWLGLPGLVFLLWLWVATQRQTLNLDLSVVDKPLSISSGVGRVSWYSDSYSSAGTWIQMSWHPILNDPGRGMFPKAFQREEIVPSCVGPSDGSDDSSL